MTKADREFVEIAAEQAAHKAYAEFKKDLPCTENIALVREHDNMLKNGLGKEVARLSEATEANTAEMKAHKAAHIQYLDEKRKDRRLVIINVIGWVIVIAGIVTTANL